MMKFCDIPTGLLNSGIRVRSFKDYDKYGTLVEVGEGDDPNCSFQWDWEREPTFFCQASKCDLEVIKVMEMTADGKTVEVLNCWWEGKDFFIHAMDNRLTTYHNAWFSHSSQPDLKGDPSITTMELNFAPVDRS